MMMMMMTMMTLLLLMMVVVVMVMVMVVKRQTAKTEILRTCPSAQYKVILRHGLSDRAPQILGADHALQSPRASARTLITRFSHNDIFVAFSISWSTLAKDSGA